MNSKYRVNISLKDNLPRTIKVETETFALATQVAEQVAMAGYTQQVYPSLWEHYLPSQIQSIFIEAIPNRPPDKE